MSFIAKLILWVLMLVVSAACINCSNSSKQASQNDSLAARPGRNTSRLQQQSQNETAGFISDEIPLYTFEVVNTFPHDTAAFTQGLLYDGGFLYESTGLYGQSSLRKVELATGKVLQIKNLDARYFGEGITIRGKEIIQLTWQNHKGFIFDKHTFDLLGDFDVGAEGWGMTTDGKRIITSDGTSTLRFLDPGSFEELEAITVQDNGLPVNNLNELEYVNGLIYANVWKSDNIAIIDPGTGRVKGWVDLKGILPAEREGKPVDVLNGIAYDSAGKRIFVTGKLWPYVFEIQLVRIN